MTDHQIIEAMRTYGGGFIRALAHLWSVADLVNQQRLKAAFADEWTRYRVLAHVQAAKHAGNQADRA